MQKSLEDKIISKFLDSLGPWSKLVIIGGGFALFVYKLYLSNQKLKNFPIRTQDIDSLLPRKVPAISKKNIAHYLHRAGFKPIFKDLDIPATESYIKTVDGVEIEIEFLTDTATRKDKSQNVTYSRDNRSAS